MKHLLAFLFFVSFAAAQSVGQYELRKRGASGFTSYGVTLSNGQVIGLMSDVPAAITPLAAGNNLSDLGSASTARTNLGLGAAALLSTSSGGNGATDSGKVPLYGAAGGLIASGALAVFTSPLAYPASELGVSSLAFSQSISLTGTLGYATLTGNRTWTLPNVTGTIITTGDTGSVTNTMLANSAITIAGTSTSLGGSITASSILDSIGSTRGSVLYRGASGWAILSPGTSGYVLQSGGAGADPSWVASGGGITIGTTTTSGASANDLLISNGTVVQKITPGTGVASALANAVNGSSGLLTYSIIGTSGATVPLLNGSNTFSAAQTIAPSSAATPLTLTGGTVTTSNPLISATQTWNAGGVTFVGEDHTFTKTSAATGSLMARWSTGSRGSVAFEEGGEILIGSFSGAGTRSGNAPAVCGATGGSLHVGCVNGNVYLGAVGTFGGNMLVNGVSNYAKFTTGFLLEWSSDSTSYGTADLFDGREGAAIKQQGVDTNGDAVDQTFKSADGITGTDRSGADLTVASGRGTGAGAVSALIFSTPTVLSTGTTAQTNTERMRINSSGVTIGSGGAAISKVLTATATLDFASTAAGTVSDLTVTVTGAAIGDVVIIGVPHGSTVAAGDFSAWVSSANTVTIRFANNALVTAYDPASGTFRATVIQH